MKRFTSISMRNFMGYGNATTVVNLDRKGTTLIRGEDLDNTGNGATANGVGKGQPMYCKVKVPGGWKTMGEMQVGDTVSTPDGYTGKVTGVFPQGIRPVYEFTLADGRKTRADAEHMWSIQTSNVGQSDVLSAPIITSTRDLIKILHDSHKTGEQFHVLLPLISNRVAGSFHLSDDFYMMGVNFHTKAEIFRNVREAQYSAEHISYENHMDFLRGLIGLTRDYDFNTGMMYSVNTEMADQICYAVRSIGGRATQLVDSCNMYIRFGLPNIALTSIEYVGEEETQCIMIDHPDHLYITDDFIVTHNTTILRAVLYAGYNETLSDMSVDQLINDVNKKEMEVSLNWIDEDTNTTYRAVRYRKMKHGNGIKFYVNGEDKTVAKGTDELIAAAIGMPFDVFVRIAIFSASYQPFLNMPTSSTTGASQRSIMEELFGLTELSDRAVSVKVAIKDLESDLKLKLATVTQAQREVQRHTDQITSAKRRVTDWYNQTDATIDRMGVTLKSVQNVDIDGQQALHKERDHLRPFLAPLQTTTRDLQRTYDQIATHIKTANGQLLSLHDSTCPYCLQEYKGASEKVDQLTIDVGEFTAESLRVVGVLSENKIEVAELKSKIDDISAQITVEDVDSLIKTRANAETTKARMLELAETINPHEDTLAELMATVIEPVSTEEIDRLENELEHAKFLLKILTKPDSFVRKALLAKNLPFLNSRLKIALLELGLPYQVEFQPDMTATLRHSRGNIRTFAQLSTGQAARVNLALAFAFADVRYRLHGKINICLLDEVLDVGLDPVGVQLAAKLIKIRARESGIAHFIITHREEALNMFDAKLTVQMSQGFSSIIDDSMIS